MTFLSKPKAPVKPLWESKQAAQNLMNDEDALARAMLESVSPKKPERVNFVGRIISTMKPGREYTSAELAEMISEGNINRVSSSLTHLRRMGRVECIGKRGHANVWVKA